MSELGTGPLDLDIMEELLNAAEDEAMPSVEDLDSLIYGHQAEPGSAPEVTELTATQHVPEGLQTDGDVEVFVSESRANIRIKVAGNVKENLSMGRIADIAIGAIMNEINGDAA